VDVGDPPAGPLRNPASGAPRAFTDGHGTRYPLDLTNLTDPDIAFGEAFDRGRGPRLLQELRFLLHLARDPTAPLAVV